MELTDSVTKRMKECFILNQHKRGVSYEGIVRVVTCVRCGVTLSKSDER